MIKKVCGLTRSQDMLHAVNAGASHLGMIHVPGTPRYLGLEASAAVLHELKSRTSVLDVTLVAVIAAIEQDYIDQLAKLYDIIQLHDFKPENLKVIPDLLGKFRDVWPVFRLRSEQDLENKQEIIGQLKELGISMVLLDAWHPDMLGGIGQSWQASRVGEIWKPYWPKWILAGGLDAKAVLDVGGWPQLGGKALAGFDASSKLEESPGVKSPRAVEEYLVAITQLETKLHP